MPDNHSPGHPPAAGSSALQVRPSTALSTYVQPPVAAGLEDDDVLVVVGNGSALAAGVTRLVGLGPDGWYGIAGMDNCHWAVLRGNRGRHPEWVLTSYNVGVL